MNIFILDQDSVLCAQYHNDKHVVKMILESCQLLSTAHRMLDGNEYKGTTQSGRTVRRWALPDAREQQLYHATYIHHPCAIWCRLSSQNYLWLCSLTTALCHEYTYRYNKVHKCQSSGLLEALLLTPHRIPNVGITPFAQAMPVDCKRLDAVDAYRTYYQQKKQHLASWKKRTIPQWY